MISLLSSAAGARGKPTQNAFIEAFNGRLRDECLDESRRHCLTDARRVIDAWREDYNVVRPHGRLVKLPLAPFAAATISPPQRGEAVRSPQGSAPRPVAPPRDRKPHPENRQKRKCRSYRRKKTAATILRLPLLSRSAGHSGAFRVGPRRARHRPDWLAEGASAKLALAAIRYPPEPAAFRPISRAHPSVHFRCPSR